MKNRKRSNMFFVVGLLCIFIALGLAGYNIWEQNRAEKQSLQILEQVEFFSEEKAAASHQAAEGLLYTKTIDGFPIAAVLRIPALELNLPVIAEWDESYLKTAPCRYFGDIYSQDLIIAAHNYPSHFGRLGALCEGESIVITDMLGKEYGYTVKVIEVLKPDEGKALYSSLWDLTLFTCTYDLQNRLIVRCERIR